MTYLYLGQDQLLRGLASLGLKRRVIETRILEKVNAMANCSDCGKKIPMFDGGRDGRCYACATIRYEAEQAPIKAQKVKEVAEINQQKAQKRAAIDSVIVTTETQPDLRISKRIKIIISTVESKFDAQLVEKQDELFQEMKKECHSIGGNAVVGVSINIVETYSVNIGAGDFKKFKIIAYGTAVVIEEKQQ